MNAHLFGIPIQEFSNDAIMRGMDGDWRSAKAEANHMQRKADRRAHWLRAAEVFEAE